MKEFHATTNRYDGGRVEMIWSGFFDEAARLPELPAELTQLTIDLGDLIYVNSGGILKWLNFMDRLSKTHPKSKLRIQKLPHFLIEQFIAIPNALSNNPEILSFKIPYFCDSCQTQTTCTYVAGEQFDMSGPVVKLDIVEQKCMSCGEQAEIDMIEERLVVFMNRLKERAGM